MSEEKGYQPPGAENFKMREAVPPPEKQGFFTAMTKGTLKGGAEMAATIAAASVTDGPVQPANLFKDENESSNYRGKSDGESDKDGASSVEKSDSAKASTDEADEVRGEEKQEKKQDTPEKPQMKREQKIAKPGRERSQPPVRKPRGDQRELSEQDEQSKEI
jgi:hypothetical protein